MFKFVVPKILFPMHEWLKGHDTVLQHKGLMQSQWYSFEQIQAIQKDKLKRFLKEISEHVPYYRQQNLPVDNLKAWPLLNKNIIRQELNTMKHETTPQLQKKATGGSTGHPLQFFVSKERLSHDVAAKWRATRWWGVDVGDLEWVIWASSIETATQSRIKKIRDLFLRSFYLPARNMTPEQAVQYLHLMQKKKPKMLFSYPSLLHHLALKAQEYNIDVSGFVKVAFVTSEVLGPFQKKEIEKVFGCPVANGYGGRESGFIAHACPLGSMHISAEDVIVEIVDEYGRTCGFDEQGEIIITHLSTQAFPFVRYQTGDLGAISSKYCPCGRGLPVLSNLEGRQSDLIVTEKGGVVHRAEIFQILSQFSQVTHFKFQQDAINRAQLWLSMQQLESAQELNIERAFRQLIGPKLDLKIHCVKEIPADPNGKHRFVVSKIKTPYKKIEDKECSES